MILRILGSSSSGNCYLLENETECLMIECGIPIKEVKKAMNFNMRKIVGCIASHRHNDHIRHLEISKSLHSMFHTIIHRVLHTRYAMRR